MDPHHATQPSEMLYLERVVLVRVPQLRIPQVLKLIRSLVQPAPQPLYLCGDRVNACVPDNISVDQRSIAHLYREIQSRKRIKSVKLTDGGKEIERVC
jgi:hypothetical protein